MTSKKQMDANKRNAQRSTGPKTEAGKQASKQNAMKEGLFARTCLADENKEEFEALQKSMEDFHNKDNDPIVSTIMEGICLSRLGLRWAYRVEKELYDVDRDRIEEGKTSPDFYLEYMVSLYAKVGTNLLDKTKRSISMHQNSIHKSVAELSRLKSMKNQKEKPVSVS